MEIAGSQLPLPKKCTGCSACMNICYSEAISMMPDDKGFLQPKVDGDKCVCCNKCTDICPILNSAWVKEKTSEPECYAAYSKDKDIRFDSTSGGVFTHLASYILKQGGAVAGARYRMDHLVEHTLIHSEDEIPALRQSKYVQSEAGFIYRESEKVLRSGRALLFVGTPCQCVGLKSYLGKDYSNLYMCDFICRGVNSPKVYKTYLDKLEKEYDSKILQVWFKNKTLGWNNFGTKIIFENGKEYFADRENDPYMLGYIKSRQCNNMRPSCYECMFKGASRSWCDITLGDFWGIDRISDIETKDGVSAIMLQSQKGRILFENVKENLITEKHTVKDIKNHNPCMENSVIVSDRDQIKAATENEKQSCKT